MIHLFYVIPTVIIGLALLYIYFKDKKADKEKIKFEIRRKLWELKILVK